MKMNGKSEFLKIILDEPRIYVNDLLGSAMVRGEVIANFPSELHMQGPIELVFEGIQKYHPWPEIMIGDALGSTIETRLQVIEISLPPPSTQGIMPSGVQRFPFEFPIPASLPATLLIPDRIEIYYQISATIRRSLHRTASKKHIPSLIMSDNAHWIDRIRLISMKKFVASTTIRIVHSLETARHLPAISDYDGQEASLDSNGNARLLSWDSDQFDSHQRTFDEHYDHLASSFTGKFKSNLEQPPSMLDNLHGIRYKIGMDRTAVALGTTIGVELLIEPTLYDAVVKSVYLTISESRKYTMEVPAKHTWDSNVPKTKRCQEGANLILKWAHGFPLSNNHGSVLHDNKYSRYVYDSFESDKTQHYFEPSDHLYGKNISNRASTITFESDDTQQFEDVFNESKGEINNLKNINQPVKLGKYFGGHFVMPVPDCSSILHPSTNHSALQIQHWFCLTVTIECNGEVFDLVLDASSRILDCRLVGVDDDSQTILPPPPLYEPGDSKELNLCFSQKSTIWEQRDTVTSATVWGSCMPCPCEHKRNKVCQKLQPSLFQKCFKSNSGQDQLRYSLPQQAVLPPSYSNC